MLATRKLPPYSEPHASDIRASRADAMAYWDQGVLTSCRLRFRIRTFSALSFSQTS
jgi:hypothetical protein